MPDLNLRKTFWSGDKLWPLLHVANIQLVWILLVCFSFWNCNGGRTRTFRVWKQGKMASIFNVATCILYLQTVLATTFFYSSVLFVGTRWCFVRLTCVPWVYTNELVPASRFHNRDMSPRVCRPAVPSDRPHWKVRLSKEMKNRSWKYLCLQGTMKLFNFMS